MIQHIPHSEHAEITPLRPPVINHTIPGGAEGGRRLYVTRGAVCVRAVAHTAGAHPERQHQGRRLEWAPEAASKAQTTCDHNARATLAALAMHADDVSGVFEQPLRGFAAELDHFDQERLRCAGIHERASCVRACVRTSASASQAISHTTKTEHYNTGLFTGA